MYVSRMIKCVHTKRVRACKGRTITDPKSEKPTSSFSSTAGYDPAQCTCCRWLCCQAFCAFPSWLGVWTKRRYQSIALQEHSEARSRGDDIGGMKTDLNIKYRRYRIRDDTQTFQQMLAQSQKLFLYLVQPTDLLHNARLAHVIIPSISNLLESSTNRSRDLLR